MAPREITVSPSTPIPQGYAFLKKGIKYKTLHCRRLTQQAGMTVFVVEHHKKTLGIRVPKSIFRQIQSQANDTLATRRLATERRDAAAIRAASTELDAQFPYIPKSDREKVLAHGFKKYSGRVGRTSQIPLPQKVLFAVAAHIRHTHTKYDAILNKGSDRDDARKAIRKALQKILKAWGATRGRN
jgi:hypothetical protein